MNIEGYIVITLVAFVALYFIVPYAVGAYIKYRGTRVITCPETRRPAAVEVDTKHASFTAAFGRTDLRLKSCSRWPERRDCNQACLLQIEIAPEDCLFKNLLAKWYEGKACVFCGNSFGEIRWSDHKPAMLALSESRIVEWNEIRPEAVYDALATNAPVCWNCGNLERLRREQPDLMFERPPREIARAAKK
jgi:hypothetical protein